MNKSNKSSKKIKTLDVINKNKAVLKAKLENYLKKNRVEVDSRE